ncbi:MAG: hypothetical protein DWH91_03345 [Planctomycetota bacterium]|nr:MAG: hypothetical protein DWH91_03345 [Planctomycetota bacterium]
MILDSDWEAEFCRVAESHPQVRAYVKNHSLGFEVPYRSRPGRFTNWPTVKSHPLTLQPTLQAAILTSRHL